ncbi:MAG: 1-acyl-sn-glycerol-3-phosphate acyltransferase [Bacteroidales bacterium]|jgi:1-acyl-sn-glycerol-3-phosphate acyltransferase|nr:1-acyl-sn-glycerol-3-phosphate acyltransferase [Bacteroidales bacterium]
MSNFFIKIFHFFEKNKFLLLLLLVIIILFSIFSVLRINVVEDISNFLPQNKQNQKYNYAYQNIGTANKIMINIKFANNYENSDNDNFLLTEVATQFSKFISENDSLNHIKNILYEVDQTQITEVTDFVVKNMPYFLSDSDYKKIDSLISSPENISQQLENDKKLLLSPMGSFLRNILTADPLLFSKSILDNLSSFQMNDEYKTEDGFIFNKQGTEAIVIITSKYPVSETSNNKLLANDIKNAIEKTTQIFDNKIKISAFGAALISITNADQIKKDSLLAGIISICLITIVLIYFFRDFRSILLIGISIIFGFLFSLGLILIFRPTISIIVIGIATIIIGIAVNYPLHFISHFNHTNDKIASIKEIVNPLLIGNITTVGAFLSLLFISSDAMKDLGLFASMLLAGTIIFVLIFLPHLLTVKKKTIKNKEAKIVFSKISNFSPEKNKWIVITVCLFSIVFFIFSLNTNFETDLHKINYMTDEQQQQMEKLLAESDKNSILLYCVAEGKNLEEALQTHEILEKNLSIINEDSLIIQQSGISDFLLSENRQKQKIDKWNNFWDNRKDKFLENFEKISREKKYSENAFINFTNILTKKYKIEKTEYFKIIKESLAENYLSINDDKVLIYTILKFNKSNENIINEKINSINENIYSFDNTSLISKMIIELSSDFNTVLYVCGFLVFIFLLMSFGRIELSILAFIPLTLAWIWILGIMNIFDMKFNIINIILATFIFGQGDDYTIFVTEGLMYEYTYKKKILANFKNSIILSAIIMLLAIGTLILAKHPAMKSLAEVTITGMASVIIMAYIFPPLIFKFLTQKKGKLRIMPITIANLANTIFSFLIFLFGIIYITTIGFFVLIIGGKTKKNKEKFHILLCNLFKFLSKLSKQLSPNIINKYNEDFKKPSIIISNHQSHLDLLYTLSLSPKIIVLTKKWVYNNSFYGIIIRYADYISITDNFEDNIEQLSKIASAGYSILIFPEGSRSEDCSIQRFHQGAFHLAKALNLDIIPVVLHGVGHIFPKTEFMLRKGKVHVEILERIKPDNKIWQGNTILEVSKAFKKLYQVEYHKLVDEIEKAEYFVDLVKKNYIYKGATIEKTAKNNLKKLNINNIDEFPNEGKLLIINCGQGEISLLTSLVKKKLYITATDKNEDLLSIAENCNSIPENLKYEKEVCYSDFDYFLIIKPKKEQIEELSKFGKKIFDM